MAVAAAARLLASPLGGALRATARSPRSACRALCRAAAPAHQDAEGTRQRNREALTPPETDGMQKKVAMAAGGVSALAGAGLIGWHHAETLVPLLPDIAGAALLVGGLGGVSYGFAGKRKTRESEKAHSLKLEVLALDDELVYESVTPDAHSAKEAEAVGVASKLLKAAQEKESKERDKENKALAEKLLAEVKDDLTSMPSKRVHQKLNPKVFVIDFDTRAPARSAAGQARAPSMREMLETLRDQVGMMLHLASPYDEVVLRVTSPGGAVSDYGLASAEFARLKAAGLRTTACVDLVAASGGYMLASAADRVIAAPFSTVGSIGVVGGVPNVHRLLERGGIEYVQRTAGRYKRSINALVPNTEEGLQKFEEELQLIHDAFITHVQTHRPAIVDAATVCTGEAWLATHAMPLGLVDELGTSAEYLRTRQREAEVLYVRRKREMPNSLAALLSRSTDAAVNAIVSSISAVLPPASWQAAIPMMSPELGSGEQLPPRPVGSGVVKSEAIEPLFPSPLLQSTGASALGRDAMASK